MTKAPIKLSVEFTRHFYVLVITDTKEKTCSVDFSSVL